MAGLDDQSLGDILSGYDTYKLPTAADALLTGNFGQLLPPGVANAIGSMGMGGMGGVPSTPGQAAQAIAQSVGTTGHNTPFYNATAADAGMMSPAQAQMMAYASGQPAMNMPNPIYSTPPAMGVFRPQRLNTYQDYAAGIPDFGGRMNSLPVGTMNFHTPESAFASSSAMSSMTGSQHDAQYMHQLATGLFRGAAGTMGSVIGAGIGYSTGGLGGAGTGSDIGGLIGEYGASYVEKPFVAMLEAVAKPALMARAQSERMRMSSRGFVGGGQSLDTTGRGLGVHAAAQLHKGLSGITNESFNKEDVLSMTQMAGSSGILDMAQNPEQMVREMKKVIKAVGVIAKVTGDPDVKDAMARIADMKHLGMTTIEATSMYSNARTYARMAGISVKDAVSGAGGRGATTAQEAGISAAAGVGIGVQAAGLASAAVGAGVFSEQELALAGGKAGVEQRIIQGSVAAGTGSAKQVLPAMVSWDSQGNPMIDPAKVEQVLNAKDITPFIGTQGLSPRQIRMLIEKSPYLLSTLNNKMGAVGNLRLVTGVTNAFMHTQPGLDRTGALMELGADAVQANTLEKILNPKTLDAIIKQQKVTNTMDLAAKARHPVMGFYSGMDEEIKTKASTWINNLGAYFTNGAASSLEQRKIEKDAEEQGLVAYGYHTNTGGGSEAAFRRRLATTKYGRVHHDPRSNVNATYDEKRAIMRQMPSLTGLGVPGVNALAAFLTPLPKGSTDVIAEVMADTADALSSGQGDTAAQAAQKMYELAKKVRTSKDGSDIVTDLSGIMRSAVNVSGASLGSVPVKFLGWEEKVRTRLNQDDPSFKHKTAAQQKKLVRDVIAAAASNLRVVDKNAYRRLQSSVQQSVGSVALAQQAVAYGSYSGSQKERSDHIRSLLSGNRGDVFDKAGNLIKAGVVGVLFGGIGGGIAGVMGQAGTLIGAGEDIDVEGVAKGVVGFSSEYGSVDAGKKAMLEYLKYRNNPMQALKHMTPKQLAKMESSIQKYGLEDTVDRLSKLEGGYEGATKSIFTESAKMVASDYKQSLLMKIRTEYGENVSNDISDKDLHKLIRSKGKSWGWSAKDISASNKNLFATLEDRLGADAVVLGAGEKMSEAGIRLQHLNRGSEAVKSLKAAVTNEAAAGVNIEAAHKIDKAANKFMTAANIIMRRKDSSDVKKHVDGAAPKKH